jgi:GTP cyclohydrolase I
MKSKKKKTPGKTSETSAETAPPERAAIIENTRSTLALLGEDIHREGLKRTPERYAKAMEFLTSGYTRDIDALVGKALFKEGSSEIVIVRDIEMFSLCEHHLLPFSGVAHVGYIPGDRIVGLSKLARVVDRFARDLQVQERLTTQIAGWFERELAPKGVGVVLEAEHSCMSLRGVTKPGARTVTSALAGLVRDDPRTRQEFLALVGRTANV